jgi:hypothetical protein
MSWETNWQCVITPQMPMDYVKNLQRCHPE